MDEQRKKDQIHRLVPSPETGMARRPVSVDVVKSAYIAQGLSAQAIADQYYLPLEKVEQLIAENNLPELRKAYVREGISKIQNEQVAQAQKLLDIELDFKKLRIVQLEKQLEDFMAYYGRHGDLYKRHPVSGEVLKDMDGIPMQLSIPNVAKEILHLKESVTMSDGLKRLMSDIDAIINGGRKSEVVDSGSDVIDMDQIDGLFRKST